MTPDNLAHENQQAQREAAKAQAEQIEKAQAANEKLVDARLAAKEKQVAEYYERKESEQPTPTQRENDLARMGIHVEEKEDDGSEWQEDLHKRVMEGNANNPYLTREVTADAPERPAKRRKRAK